MSKKLKTNIVLIALIQICFSSSLFAGLTNEKNVIHWAGCGITKKAFMAELAAGFEKKTGIKVDLQGGGATKGIRQAAKLKIDLGGSCRMTLPDADPSELHATLHPV
ncbi:MAG: hypothetical protein P8Y28_12270, partial [Gammaproteobacteria bacterium]